jgi:transcriptional repressor NrdR
MNCIFCRNADTEVIETRVSENGTAVRRRRVCATCQKRFTTYERAEELPILVVKRDGKRERFDREKLAKGIVHATGKTSVTADQIKSIVDQVEMEIKQLEHGEIESKKIGNSVAKRLKNLDKIAYIRFASVFRRFVDVEEFEKEVKKLL